VLFAANYFHRMEVKCVNKLALLHKFDDSVAVVAITVASITTGIVQFHAKSRLRRLLLQVGVRFVCRGRVRGASASSGSGHGSGTSSGGSEHLPTSVSLLASTNDRLRALQTPQANVAFSLREHRKRYGMLRNILFKQHMTIFVHHCRTQYFT